MGKWIFRTKFVRLAYKSVNNFFSRGILRSRQVKLTSQGSKLTEKWHLKSTGSRVHHFKILSPWILDYWVYKVTLYAAVADVYVLDITLYFLQRNGINNEMEIYNI